MEHPRSTIAVKLRTSTIWYMSLAAAVGTAPIYVLQPAIADVADSLGTSVTALGLAMACAPLGYLCGLALLVPLIDRYQPRLVLAGQFAALSVAMALNAVAMSARMLGLTMLFVGAFSSVGAGLSSMTGRLVVPERRATVLGIVTSGISVGILAGRMTGGWLSDLVGWRGMLAVFAAACGLAAVGCLKLLPAARGTHQHRYWATLASVPSLFRRFAQLRSAAFRGGLWFFAFCSVWSGIAVALSQPPYSYSAERIGLYALAGLLGVVVTRFAGARTDLVGARPVILTGLALAGVAGLCLTWALPNAAATFACLAIFDAGLFAAQVANQSSVLAIDPPASARLNSAYMVVYFAGGSLGTAVGAASAEGFGWAGATSVASVAIALAALMTLAGTAAPTRTS